MQHEISPDEADAIFWELHLARRNNATMEELVELVRQRWHIRLTKSQVWLLLEPRGRAAFSNRDPYPPYDKPQPPQPRRRRWYQYARSGGVPRRGRSRAEQRERAEVEAAEKRSLQHKEAQMKPAAPGHGKWT